MDTHSAAPIFSFCIYGSNPKYCKGLVENLKTIASDFPDFHTWIVAGNNVPQSYLHTYLTFPNVHLTHVDLSGHQLMAHRFFPIDDPTVDIMFVRDADSRIDHRDIWCIKQFMASNIHKIMTIRDHPHHVFPLMGGQWAMRKIDGLSIKRIYNRFTKIYENDINGFGADQDFLYFALYRKYRNSLFIAYIGNKFLQLSNDENYILIDLPHKDKYDFCGNVYDYDEAGNLKIIYEVA
jgi:hypothetical protein